MPWQLVSYRYYFGWVFVGKPTWTSRGVIAGWYWLLLSLAYPLVFTLWDSWPFQPSECCTTLKLQKRLPPRALSLPMCVLWLYCYLSLNYYSQAPSLILDMPRCFLSMKSVCHSTLAPLQQGCLWFYFLFIHFGWRIERLGYNSILRCCVFFLFWLDFPLGSCCLFVPMPIQSSTKMPLLMHVLYWPTTTLNNIQTRIYSMAQCLPICMLGKTK